MATQSLLRKERFSIDLEFKCAFASGYEHKFVYDVLVIKKYILRQTDGTCGIISRHAIFK